MEMTSCLFRKDVPRPRSVSARCRDARGWKTGPRPVTGSRLLEHTLHYTPPHPHLASQRHCTPCPADPHHPTQTHLHTYHTPRHKNTHHARFPSHITRHISTHATVATHTYVPCVHGYSNTQRHTQMHKVTPNLDADNHSSHIHSGRGRAAGTEKKPQVLVYNLNLLLCCFSTMGTI